MALTNSKSILVYAPEYNTNLSDYGVDKPFALDRGRLVLEKLASDFGMKIPVQKPQLISETDLALVHSKSYLDSLHSSDVWAKLFEFKGDEYRPENAKIPLHQIYDDIRLKCGGTLAACETALKEGLAANLGGGYHHAFPDQGRGFCALNDIAVSIRSVQKRNLADRVLVVDLDYHQGDGTALAFQGDHSVFTLSVHSEEGWPEEKQRSDLDIAIKSEDSHLYLEKTRDAINQCLKNFAPDLVLFVAGSDPYELDVLPGTRFLQLSEETLKLRDHFVIDTFSARNIPLAMVFAGGYGPHVWKVHFNAVKHLLISAGVLNEESAAR